VIYRIVRINFPCRFRQSEIKIHENPVNSVQKNLADHYNVDTAVYSPKTERRVSQISPKVA
jgi:hypothetical protein